MPRRSSGVSATDAGVAWDDVTWLRGGRARRVLSTPFESGRNSYESREIP